MIGIKKTCVATICVALVLLSTGPLMSQIAAPAAEPSATENSSVEPILNCLEKGQEALLRQRSPVQCVAFGSGVDTLKKESPNAPMNVKTTQACNDPQDMRRLPPNAIKLLAKQIARIDPIGIRVIGGVYCEQLDLIGLELPYSLVLDGSVFAQGIMGRSFRGHGDLSFDESLIFGELFLPRAHIDGTIFASGSLIQKMRLLDSEVHGSALFRYSLFLELVAFDTLQLSGELSVRGSVFPYLLIQFSKVNGVLDLTQSQARCSYKIRKSEMGDVFVVHAGFGTAESASQGTEVHYLWTNQSEGIRSLLEAANNGPEGSALGAASSATCDHSSISYSPGAFLFSDTRIKSSLCLRAFDWPSGTQTVASYLTLDNISVGTAALIDPARPDADRQTSSKRKLEIMEFATGSLFLDFNDPKQNQPFQLSLSGLKFEHVYASKVSCDYDPFFSDTDTARNALADTTKRIARSRTLGNDADPASNSRLPHVDEVMGWLSGNTLATTQPFAAFVDDFQKHGEDNDAKSLRVAKADAELCIKARRVLGEWVCGKGTASDTRVAADDHGAPASASVSTEGINLGARINDAATVVLGAVLWLIADNGYRPEKVSWFVVLSIVLSFIYFWFGLKAVGIQPKEKHIILPIGIVFLFDRMLPAYQIREDHYDIAAFLKRLSKSEREAKPPPKGIRKMTYLKKEIFVVPVTDEKERLRIERSLDVLKVIGLVFAVFLVAAINAIVSH